MNQEKVVKGGDEKAEYYNEPVSILINGRSLAKKDKIFLFDKITAASSFYPPYFWNFGDGTLDQASGKHVYDRPGRYKLTLKRPDGQVLATREMIISSLSRPVDNAFRVLDNMLENRYKPDNLCDLALPLYNLKNNPELVFELVDELENIRKFSLQDFVSYLCQQSKLPFSKIERISSDPGDGGLQTITLRK